MEERKGVLTPEQEKTLDDLVQLSGIAESLDGLAISLIDNQGIELLKGKLEEKYPGAVSEFVYPIIDAIFAGLETIAKEE